MHAIICGTILVAILTIAAFIGNPWWSGLVAGTAFVVANVVRGLVVRLVTTLFSIPPIISVGLSAAIEDTLRVTFIALMVRKKAITWRGALAFSAIGTLSESLSLGSSDTRHRMIWSGFTPRMSNESEFGVFRSFAEVAIVYGFHSILAMGEYKAYSERTPLYLFGYVIVHICANLMLLNAAGDGDMQYNGNSQFLLVAGSMLAALILYHAQSHTPRTNHSSG